MPNVLNKKGQNSEKQLQAYAENHLKTQNSLNKKGQTPIELIVVAVVITALLLLVLITTYNTNSNTERLLAESQNSIQCSEMGSVIARLNHNRATIKETLLLSENAKIERIEGKPGGITVGTISCEYIGSVEKTTGEKDIDAGGFSLAKGKWCFSKSDGVIALNEGDCA